MDPTLYSSHDWYNKILRNENPGDSGSLVLLRARSRKQPLIPAMVEPISIATLVDVDRSTLVFVETFLPL